MTTPVVPRISWADFLRVFDWKQDQHVSMIGTTGAGKSVLGLLLMERRKFSVAFGTKPKDRTLTQMANKGHWTRIRSWDERTQPVIIKGTPNAAIPPERYILWPTFKRIEDVKRHRHVFEDALDDIWLSGAWSVFGDEVWYLTKKLGLGPKLEEYWSQGRSLGVSLVTATQRPAHVPLLMYSQAGHLFVWRTNDVRDAKRLREVGGFVDQDAMFKAVRTLDFRRHEVLWISTTDGRMAITIPPDPNS